MAPYLLLIAGWVFLYLEFFLPGGLMGVIGGIGLVLAVVLFAFEAPPIWAMLLFIAAVVVVTALLVKWTLRQIRATKKTNSMYLADDQEGFRATSYDASLVGKECITDTDFRPAGHILVEGRRLQALSKSGYIEPGVAVIIIGGEGAHLIIKPIV